MSRRHAFALSRSQRRTVRAMAGIVCPDDLDALGCGERVIDEVELTLASFPAAIRLGVSVTLTAFEWLAVLSPASPGRRFSAMSRPRQERWFAAWWHHAFLLVRQAIKGVKGLIGMAYYELPAVRARLGYRPEDWIAEVGARRLHDHGEAIRAAEALVTAPDPLPRLVPATGLVRRPAREGSDVDAA